MSYTTEWANAEITNPSFKCPKCTEADIEFREWESSDGAHDDVHYRCSCCGYEWWVEGVDA